MVRVFGEAAMMASSQTRRRSSFGRSANLWN